MLASEMARFKVRKSVGWREARCLYRTNMTKLFPNQDSHPTERQHSAFGVTQWSRIRGTLHSPVRENGAVCSFIEDKSTTKCPHDTLHEEQHWTIVLPNPALHREQNRNVTVWKGKNLQTPRTTEKLPLFNSTLKNDLSRLEVLG